MERLQKYMASCGVDSRRKCEDIILQGRVKINGDLVKELGIKVNPEKDIVTVDNKIIKKEENKKYIALNKPTGYISSVKDDRGRKTILDLVDVKERIYPIGRLDYDTSGLILLTNDGDFYNKVIHPSQEKEKVYVATIKGIPTSHELHNFKKGLVIDDYLTSPSKIEILSIQNGNAKVKISIIEGRNRQVRKMCEKINHPVIKLKRISIAHIELGDLPIGNWRYLTQAEIDKFNN
ncbi:pseudouridine synthase [Clostridium cochlearium]|uniref:Pseudouridine synthase n=2 Tax=Clostridium cochlearium TaxID=1494 RepID=A0A239ZZC7_CLOCO|nr:pseudouridine synthase [Clostridium cochlearium]MBV1819401.1 rRNA pseudouridine synthase [Bacteroidales bacterium MSK.15.36]NSJ90624.1 rRNA pseudouridine synthase [Coprococcus sp. MSK.21.13]MBE6064370.1 rRNA pseudouridine synthase [Clostridium cochlearium]MCR1970615.1 rRNA pseudouridine synthase [Clostridium cochlearium]NME94954.1 rRNA pseudouridine synthase [Clostridium cochlearium]